MWTSRGQGPAQGLQKASGSADSRLEQVFHGAWPHAILGRHPSLAAPGDHLAEQARQCRMLYSFLVYDSRSACVLLFCYLCVLMPGLARALHATWAARKLLPLTPSKKRETPRKQHTRREKSKLVSEDFRRTPWTALSFASACYGNIHSENASAIQANHVTFSGAGREQRAGLQADKGGVGRE